MQCERWIEQATNIARLKDPWQPSRRVLLQLRQRQFTITKSVGPRLSGSRRAAMPSGPLRTVRASLPAHGSSLDYPVATSLVELAVAMAVKRHEVVNAVVSTGGARCDMVVLDVAVGVERQPAVVASVVLSPQHL